MVRIGYGSCIGSAIGLIWCGYRSLSVAASVGVSAVGRHRVMLCVPICVCVCVRKGVAFALLQSPSCSAIPLIEKLNANLFELFYITFLSLIFAFASICIEMRALPNLNAYG